MSGTELPQLLLSLGAADCAGTREDWSLPISCWSCLRLRELKGEADGSALRGGIRVPVFSVEYFQYGLGKLKSIYHHHHHRHHNTYSNRES